MKNCNYLKSETISGKSFCMVFRSNGSRLEKIQETDYDPWGWELNHSVPQKLFTLVDDVNRTMQRANNHKMSIVTDKFNQFNKK